MVILGRDAELASIDTWLRNAARSEPPATTEPSLLIIEGAPGIGKTTLWAEAIRKAQALGRRVLSCRPVPSDAGLPHVGIADLLREIPDDAFTQLPAPQHRALGVALLREDAGAEGLDPRAVGTGLAALLGILAEDDPLLIAMDDAQWLDPASARSVAFALRRLGGGAVAALASIRIDGSAGSGWPGPRGGAFAMIESSLASEARQRLDVGPLTVAATHQMFRQVLGESFSRPLLVRIHRAAGGNPFYSLEIAREVRRVGSPLPGEPLPIPGDQRELALLRMRRLPSVTRDLLAALAATSGAAAVDLDVAALAPARVEFTHPLFGSALYSSLPESSRRRLHRELASKAASTQERARHLALAASGPDEATATELDAASAAARARGAADVAVELKELACRLTPAPDIAARIRRGTELAGLRYFSGDPSGARRELERLLTELPAGEGRAEVLLELGSMRWIQGEAEAGRELMIRALSEAETSGLRARIHVRIASGADDADLTLEHGEAGLALLDADQDPQLYSFALQLVALYRLYAGRGADHAAIEQGMRLQREAFGWEVSPAPAFWARNFDDFATARQRFEDLIRGFRDQGDEAQVCAALAHLANVECMTGRMDLARALVAEALELAGQTEQDAYRDMALCAKGQVYAQAGDRDDLAEARAAASELLGRLQTHPDQVLEAMARGVLGQAALSEGELAEADREMSRADEILELVHNREPANHRFQADHVEAVVGLGDLQPHALLDRRVVGAAAVDLCCLRAVPGAAERRCRRRERGNGRLPARARRAPAARYAR